MPSSYENSSSWPGLLPACTTPLCSTARPLALPPLWMTEVTGWASSPKQWSGSSPSSPAVDPALAALDEALEELSRAIRAERTRVRDGR